MLTVPFLLCQLMTDVAGNPEEERRTEFYQAPWVPEAVGRYIYSKVRNHIVLLEEFGRLSSRFNFHLHPFIVSGAAEKTRIGAGVGYPTHLKADSTANLNVYTRSMEIRIIL